MRVLGLILPGMIGVATSDRCLQLGHAGMEGVNRVHRPCDALHRFRKAALSRT